MAFWIILATTLIALVILTVVEVRKFAVHTRRLFVITLVLSALSFGGLFAMAFYESHQIESIRPESEKTYSLENLNNVNDIRLYVSVGEIPRALNYIYYDETKDGDQFAVAASAPAERSRVFQHEDAVDPVVTITKYTYQNSFLLPFKLNPNYVTYDFSIPENGLVESAITKKVGSS